MQPCEIKKQNSQIQAKWLSEVCGDREEFNNVVTMLY